MAKKETRKIAEKEGSELEMKVYRRVFVIAGIASILSAQSLPTAANTHGPFGFHVGMSRQEAIAAVGTKAIDPEMTKGDSLALTSAPKPYPDFSLYNLTIGQTLGLVKLIAASEPFAVNSFGYELKTKFAKIAAGVTATYGEPTKYDFLKSGSIWDESRDWTMGLFKKERTLEYIWEPPKDNPAHIVAISLQASAVSGDEAFLMLIYEFDNFHQYSLKINANQDSVF